MLLLSSYCRYCGQYDKFPSVYFDQVYFLVRAEVNKYIKYVLIVDKCPKEGEN